MEDLTPIGHLILDKTVSMFLYVLPKHQKYYCYFFSFISKKRTLLKYIRKRSRPKYTGSVLRILKSKKRREKVHQNTDCMKHQATEKQSQKAIKCMPGPESEQYTCCHSETEPKIGDLR